jgi:RNA polymerase sigma-70 factor (ECF subfamily)
MSRHDPMNAGLAARPASTHRDDYVAAAGVRASEAETGLAGQVQDLIAAGDQVTAREVFSQIVTRQQRRASRIALHYLRDGAEADEAVQDAFVKAYTHISSFQSNLSFEVWFTRILINGCLDRRKMRARRDRWFVSAEDAGVAGQVRASTGASGADPESRLLGRERRARLTAAIDRLEGRQRTVFMLCHYGDCTPGEVSAMLGLNESTVRVHLFRAARRLRAWLGGQP